MEQKKYRIVGSCNPYHARFHYNGYNEVLRYDGMTPVEWVVDDDYGYGFTLEEAMNKLDSYADNINDDTLYIDNAWLREMIEEVVAEETSISDTSWYKGAGWYKNNVLVYQHGDMSLRDDVMLYSITEIE